jgi:hypothetical protein
MPHETKQEVKTIEELYEQLESIGVNAELHIHFNDEVLTESFVSDALEQFISIHEYAIYDKDFEPDGIEELKDIIALNMNTEVSSYEEEVFERWVGDFVVLLATGAVNLDEYIQIRD